MLEFLETLTRVPLILTILVKHIFVLIGEHLSYLFCTYVTYDINHMISGRKKNQNMIMIFQ